MGGINIKVNQAPLAKVKVKSNQIYSQGNFRKHGDIFIGLFS